MSSTSIDDLLSFEEERPAPAEPSRGGRVGRVLRTVAGVAAVVVVLVAGLRVVGLRVSLPVLVAGVVALFLVRRVVAALAPPPRSGGRAPATTDDDGTWNWAPATRCAPRSTAGNGRWTGPGGTGSGSPSGSCRGSASWPTSGCASATA